MKNSKMTKFERLPKEIQERMLQNQEIQTGKRNPEVFKNNVRADFPDGGFLWDDSLEGMGLWSEVIDYSNFDAFYSLFPKEENQRC